MLVKPGKGGGGTPILEHGGNFRSIDPHFWHFPIPLGLFLCPTRSYWPPLSAENIGLSLSHLVPEIIWPKVGLIFYKNLSFDHFEAICINFLLDFRSCWHPFFTVLISFWPLIFTKHYIPLGPIYHHVLDPPYQTFGEVSPPTPELSMCKGGLLPYLASKLIWTIRSQNLSLSAKGLQCVMTSFERLKPREPAL